MQLQITYFRHPLNKFWYIFLFSVVVACFCWFLCQGGISAGSGRDHFVNKTIIWQHFKQFPSKHNCSWSRRSMQHSHIDFGAMNMTGTHRLPKRQKHDQNSPFWVQNHSASYRFRGYSSGFGQWIIKLDSRGQATGNGWSAPRGANLNGCVGYAAGMSYIWEWSFKNLGPTEGRTN